jgi:hypothetical protein
MSQKMRRMAQNWKKKSLSELKRRRINDTKEAATNLPLMSTIKHAGQVRADLTHICPACFLFSECGSVAWIFVTAGSLPGAGLRTFYALLAFNYVFLYRDTGRSDAEKCLVFLCFWPFVEICGDP